MAFQRNQQQKLVTDCAKVAKEKKSGRETVACWVGVKMPWKQRNARARLPNTTCLSILRILAVMLGFKIVFLFRQLHKHVGTEISSGLLVCYLSLANSICRLLQSLLTDRKVMRGLAESRHNLGTMGHLAISHTPISCFCSLKFAWVCALSTQWAVAAFKVRTLSCASLCSQDFMRIVNELISWGASWELRTKKPDKQPQTCPLK